MIRILGVDYGRRRVGFAVSDPDNVLAVPVAMEEVSSDREACEQVRKHCQETGAGRVVVGSPIHMNGAKGEMAQAVDLFVDRLRRTLGVPVETWDERWSTRVVERAMRDADVRSRARKAVRDKMAAREILQDYLDAHANHLGRDGTDSSDIVEDHEDDVS